MRLCRVVEERQQVAPGVDAGLGIRLRRAALEEQIVLHALDTREREDAQVGKRPVRHQDRVPSLGIFEKAEWERMAVRLDPVITMPIYEGGAVNSHTRQAQQTVGQRRSQLSLLLYRGWSFR